MAISHKHRFNVDDYQRIAAAQALGERRVELVDVRARSVIVARTPQTGAYSDVKTIATGEIEPGKLPEVRITVAEIFAHLDR